MAATKSILTEADVDDFNEALSLIYLGARIENIDSVDEGVHLRNLCKAACHLLCRIRNRITPDGIEVPYPAGDEVQP